MNVLIIGATGGTGRELVKQALERGHSVTALVRKPERANFSDPKVKIMHGNVLDYESVIRSMEGQDAVLSALGHKRWLGPTKILSEGTKNIIKAMESHNVSRFICETSLSVGESFGRLGLYYTLFVIPIILPFYFWDKRRQEKIIRDSSLKWTIVRPGPLNNRKGRKKYKHGEIVGNYIWTFGISRADVADFMLNQLTDETYLRKAPGCVGRIFT
ncbi:MAG TPA: SDR family oxidoreductase [candidate division Zixibacteria bacterium]|nr:SDR family oxidoreductase [candidate division Zixibacteria bacterium]